MPSSAFLLKNDAKLTDRVCAIYVVKIYHNFNTADELYLPKSSPRVIFQMMVCQEVNKTDTSINSILVNDDV